MYYVGLILWIAVLCGLLHLRLPSGDVPGQWIPTCPYYILWFMVVGGAALFHYSMMDRVGHGHAALVADAVAVALYLAGRAAISRVRLSLTVGTAVPPPLD